MAPAARFGWRASAVALSGTVLALAVSCSSPGASTRPAANTDADKAAVIEAARNSIVAEIKGNSAAMVSTVCCSSVDEAKAAQAWADGVASQVRLDRLVQDHFGLHGRATLMGVAPERVLSESESIRQLDSGLHDARVDVSGENARVLIMVGSQMRVLDLVRCDGHWRLTTNSALHLSRDGSLALQTLKYQALSSALTKTADGVDSGAISSAADVRAALGTAMQDQKAAP